MLKADTASGASPDARTAVSACSAAARALLFLLLFAVLSVAWTWPLATRLGSRIAHDPGDPILNTWLLWWNAQARPFSAEWWNAPIFHPLEGALALSEHLAGIAALTTPLHWAGASPITTYNVALIAAFSLCGYLAFVLGRALTGSWFAGLVAGVAFAFAPYRAGQLAHLQVLHAQWMLVVLFAMHRYLDTRGRRWLLAAGAGWLLQALSNGYFLFYFPVLVATWLLWFGSGRDPASGVRRWSEAATLAVTLAVASVLLIPVLARYHTIHSRLRMTRRHEEMLSFSASPASLLDPAPLLAFWPDRQALTTETFLFPGVTVVALITAGAIWGLRSNAVRNLIRVRSAGLFYAAAAALMFWLSMGPADSDGVLGIAFRPYTALAWLPGFGALRAPARFATLAVLCLALSAAVASARTGALTRRSRFAVRAVILAGLFLDAWTDPMPLVPAPQKVLVPHRGGAVLELPADDFGVNLGAMYRSMHHRLPVVNGYSGHVPPHYAVLTAALLREDPSVLWHFAAREPLFVLVHRAKDVDGAWRRYVESAGGRRVQEFGVGTMFELRRAQGRDASPAGAPVADINVNVVDGAATVDLGASRAVNGVAFAVRWRHEDLAPRMTIAVSPDGVAWTPAWDDWTGSLVLAASLREPRQSLVVIPLPEMQVRHLRLQPAPEWLASELQVLARDVDGRR